MTFYLQHRAMHALSTIVNCGLLKRAYTHRSIKGYGGDSNNNRDSRDTDDNEPRIC